MTDAATTIDGIDEAFPLTPAQLGMLYHSLAEPGTGVYVGILDAKLPDDVDLELFRQAWDIVIGRHDALRSVIVWEGVDEPLQVVRSACKIHWEMLDEPLPVEDHRVSRDYVEAFRKEGIELSGDLAMRFALGRLTSGEHCFLWSCTHTLIDDWSQALVLAEVQATYHVLRAGGEPETEMGTAIGAFADWLAERDVEADEDFWRRTFAGLPSPTRLQVSGACTAENTTHLRDQVDCRFDRETSERLGTAAKNARVTLAALATGVWSVVLHRLTGAEDIPFGLAATQRPPEVDGIETAIGNFVTTLPARSRIADHATLRDLIVHQHNFVQDAQPRCAIALPEIQGFAGLPSSEPLIDSILSIKQDALAVLNTEQQQLFQDPSIHFKSNFPLAVVVMPGDEIALRVIYDPRRHNAEAAKLVLSCFAAALSAAPNGMDASPGTLSLISDAGMARATEGLVGAALPEHTNIVAEVQSAAQTDPSKVALKGTSGSHTYGELKREMEAIATRLNAAGIGRGDRVGLFLDRSMDVPIAMLGCLAAGAAYVPFDAAFPEKRLDRMIAAAKLSAIITTNDHQAVMSGKSDRLLMLDDLKAELDTPAAVTDIADEDVAYVMFTSGSTGAPKGVVVTHGNLAASTAARTAWYGSSPQSYLLLSSHAFDSSVAGIYWTLATGGTLLVPDADEVRSVSTLSDMLQSWDVTHTLCLPSLYGLLLDTAPDAARGLQVVIVAGEATTFDLISRHRETGQTARLVNEYGPTEATVWCAAADLTEFEPDQEVAIGGPIPGATLRVLDKAGQPVPPGLPGELYVSGAGVAKGYFSNSVEAELHFAKAPDGTQQYRTGDIVAQRANGALVYLGRTDAQVKIRGYRVDLSEIEAVLASRPDVREAAAVVFGESSAAKLVGYVQAKEGATLLPVDLTEICKKTLPPYMVPAEFVLLQQMPRTPNGKIDRNALPKPSAPSMKAEIVKAATPTEAVLAELWRVALWHDREIGINEDFHDLGGHSLIAIRLLNDISETFGIRIPASSVGRITTVEEQSKLIEIVLREGARTEKPAIDAPTPDALSGLTVDDDAMLAILAGNWKAPAAREGFKTRVANADGNLPPLFFFFLDEYSFDQVVNALGRDQPVYGLRAANGVIPIRGQEDAEANMRRTAISYLTEVIELAGDGPILLGGYCQGATVALNLASLLTVLQRSVATVILIDKTPPIQYAGHVDIMFAEQGFLNPYLQYDQPELVWARRYGSHSFELVPGDYVKLFQPQYMVDLGTSLRKRLAEARLRSMPTLPNAARSMEWGEEPFIDAVRPEGTRMIDIRLRNTSAMRWPKTEESGVRIKAVLKDSHDSVISDHTAYAELAEALPSGGEAVVPLAFQAPEKPGHYKLEIDLIEEGVAAFSKMGNAKLELPINVSADAPASDSVISTDDDTPIASVANALKTITSEAAARGASYTGDTEEIEDSVAISLRNLGQLHLRNGRMGEAEKALSAALEMQPTDGSALLSVARVRLSERRFVAAQRMIWRAKALSPDISKEASDLQARHLSPRSFARFVRDKIRARIAQFKMSKER